MGEVTGPISTLPGAAHSLPHGAKCDEHPDRKAVVRLQGETDSFGAELLDMCEECRAEYVADMRSDDARSGPCDWCRAEAQDLANTRDYDEGTRGPVYRVCGACRKRQNDSIIAACDF